MAKTGEVAVGRRRSTSLSQNPRTGACGVSTSGELREEFRNTVCLEVDELPVAAQL